MQNLGNILFLFKTNTKRLTILAKITSKSAPSISSQVSPHFEGGEKGEVIKSNSTTPSHNNKITISFLTPLRLRFDGHITDKIEFHIFIRNLLRRISSLSYFHCDEKLQDSYLS